MDISERVLGTRYWISAGAQALLAAVVARPLRQSLYIYIVEDSDSNVRKTIRKKAPSGDKVISVSGDVLNFTEPGTFW